MARALIPHGVLVQVLLVVVLCIPPLKAHLSYLLLDYLGGDLAIPPLLVRFLRHQLCCLCLVGGKREDGRAVLGSYVVALTVEGGGIVDAVEELDESPVGEEGRVEDEEGCFGVCLFVRIMPLASLHILRVNDDGFGGRRREGGGAEKK